MADDKDFFRLPGKDLTAGEFWDVYFSGNLLQLSRNRQEGYTGEFSQYTRGQFLPKDQPFTISAGELRQYGYGEDARFLSGAHAELGQCFAAALRMPVMEAETEPNERQLELARRVSGFTPEEPLEYERLRTVLIERFTRAQVSLERVLEWMVQTRPGPDEYQLYEETGRMTALRSERVLLVKALALTRTDPRVTEALAGVVESAYEDSEVVASAIWAIGRHNDKAVLPRLLMWLGQKRLAFHSLAIEHALQFLCSGSQLVPLAVENERDYWKSIMAGLPGQRGAWLKWDASSVFWQKRLRCALFTEEPGLIETLRDDEVLQVRQVASSHPQKR